ncbi:MAG: hypothetical protein JXB15_06655 [Anaerolineales bacterium]|nr:hypothetical protein [Anaerolineales bacterium]
MATTTDKDRPLGVWLLTIYSMIFDGLVPIGAIVFLLVSGLGVVSEPVWLSVAFPILLSGLIIWFAFATWRGDDRSRKIYLILVAVFYGLIGINNLIALMTGQVAEQNSQAALGRVLRGVLYPALWCWYFNRRETKRFYEREEPALPVPTSEPEDEETS